MFVRHIRDAFNVARKVSGQNIPDQKNTDVAKLTDEAFRVSHWAENSSASRALAQMATRFSKGNSAISAKIRARQDLAIDWQLTNNKLLKAISRASESRQLNDEKQLRVRLKSIEDRLHKLDRLISSSFPEYAILANPQPLSIKQVQSLLEPDEVLVALLDTVEQQEGHSQTFIWAVSKDKVIWAQSELGGKALREKVATLRRALDPSNGTRGVKKTRGLATDSENDFDLTLAHELYRELLGPVEELLVDKKHLLVMPSGPLTALPFHVLVSKPPNAGLLGYEMFRQAEWLMKQLAITTLPSVSSLQALRGITRNGTRARLKLIGFADPVFSPALPDAAKTAEASRSKGGAEPEAGKRAKNKAVSRKEKTGYASFFRGGLTDLSAISQLAQLPETRTELTSIARTLKIPQSDILLGRDATESIVKRQKLDQYRIVYFATHGLVAGDIRDLAEPALAFSVPLEASEEDDGLLTASEVAQLKLNADWIVMSACNTASGDRPGAEALSGLARAFFYAGAKTLLVSHWPVYSDAATALTTRAFSLMSKSEQQGNPIGRSEALRRAMLALMRDRSKDDNAHPGVWAPFVVVGEGAMP